MEKSIEKTVVGLAEQAGYFVRKVQWPGINGAPDRVFIRGGVHIWIEFKDRGKTQTGLALLQGRNRKAMAEAGVEVHVVDSVRKACAILSLPYTIDPLRPHH
jgi:hypothetical protein